MDDTMQEQMGTLEIAEQLGLLPDEFEKIIALLGRQPNFTEVSIFSVMWSEHCSYKNSIFWIKQLPRNGKRILAKAGEENAGLVDLGNGLACSFKIESHNHPSAIEPYQGAATGVGGIHRDIFTMGARPIASLNSLRFGDLDNDKTKHLLKGVVKGIGDYGNSFGVPTVGGEVYFNKSYEINPLVNAMSVGIVKVGKNVSAISYGKGNPVYIVGSATGKDGIHGATFASANITEESAEKLPAVQVGDPFQEKKLLEATLESIETGAIIGMQDMGAAGITCSTSEMSDKGKHGMKIQLDKVPVRQQNMKPFEILLSESQERMLIVIEKGKEKEFEAVFQKWDINCVIIGEVTEGNDLEYFMGEELVAKVPASELVLGGGAPIYQREYKEPKYIEEVKQFKIDDIPKPKELKLVAEKLISSPNIGSKRWIYDQYDSMVGIHNMSTNAPSDAAVIRIKRTNKALAMSTDCNGKYVNADPYTGAAIAISEAARNVVCSGGEPVAVTNCLNFGNPYNPEVYWQFVNTIKGMGAACERFDTPVTGGNVSFYNQSSDEGPVFPTPTIGMLGILDDRSLRMTLDFKKEHDLIYLIGAPKNDISSSEYLDIIHQVEYSPPPYFDLEEEYQLQEIIKSLIKAKKINSAHDLSEGGLLVALFESAMPNHLGFEISLDPEYREDAYLFGEAQSRVIISVDPNQQKEIDQLLTDSAVEYKQIGKVLASDVIVDGQSYGVIKDWQKMYDTSLEMIMNAE